MANALRTLLLLLFASVVAACGTGGGATTSSSRSASVDASRALSALGEEVFERDLAQSPTWASSLGDFRYDDRWDDVSAASIARQQAFERDVLGRLARIPRAGLSREDTISYDVLRRRFELAVAGQRFALHVLPINQRYGIQTADELADALPFANAKQHADWNARLASFGRYMDDTIALLEEGVRRGITQPRGIMQRVVAQIDAQIVDDPAKSPFYVPYSKPKGGLATLPEHERERLSAEARASVRDVVVPAFRRLRAFWTERYLPACKETVGAWQWPDGQAAYAHLVRLHTTRDVSPDAVHALGLREVARIRGEMEKVRARIGRPATLKELFAELRTDPRFYLRDGEQLLARYRELTKRIDPLLPRVFRTLPRTPYDVAPIPAATAPDTTTAYYREPAADGSRPGTYFVNLYKPETRPTWEMTALTLHEAVPGHHLQIALAMENTSLPRFRRHAEHTAFIEGWALYAESLGDELGLYADPYAKMGQLVYEMWRAVRLVVDTGMHHLRWDRQRAIDFFLDVSGRPEHDVVNEVDRYAAWAGQALAYKTGELAIKELRRKKEEALGARFDVRAFHDAVLREGPLPLDVLERVVMEEGR